ncbi:MAG: hypothetical protein JXC32_05725 [Anaerolineae bacterium]|nr:hypothetical protein [Anaerolineae bacterium]
MTEPDPTKNLPHRCGATRRDGTPCKAWAVRGSSPPLCVAHGGRASGAGSAGCAADPADAGMAAPVEPGPVDLTGLVHITGRVDGSRPAPPDGVPLPVVGEASPPDTLPVEAPAGKLERIEDVFEDLASKQIKLSAYIDRCLAHDSDLAALAKLFALHGQNASRLGRLLRDQRALSGAAADGIAGAIAQALDELSNELGADL